MVEKSILSRAMVLANSVDPDQTTPKEQTAPNEQLDQSTLSYRDSILDIGILMD